jgi:BlaI family transcriptional regulator, penicillinase repressor
MPRPPSLHPTDVELEILRVLWTTGPASLSAVCEQLRQEREVAATTVATMLRVMSDKNLVKRNGNGRGATWVAAVTQARTERGMVSRLVDRVFDGAADRLVAHLVEGGQLTSKQLTDLRQLLDQKTMKDSHKDTKARKGKKAADLS